MKIIHKDNEGSIKTRQRGVEESNFDYIKFIDEDGWVDKNIVENSSIKEVLEDKGSKKCFEKEFLNAIESKNIQYLYDLGKTMYNNSRLRMKLINVFAQLNIL